MKFPLHNNPSFSFEQYVPPVRTKDEEFRHMLDPSKTFLKFTDESVEQALSGQKNDLKVQAGIRKDLKFLRKSAKTLEEMRSEDYYGDDPISRDLEAEYNTFVHDLQALILKAEDIPPLAAVQEKEN